MSDRPSDTVEEDGPPGCFALLVDTLACEPAVTCPDPSSRRFGSSALKFNGSIFAMLARGHLVVELPREWVGQVIEDGNGRPFDVGKGTPMKEGLTVEGEDKDTWLALAREALAFGGGTRP